MITSNKRYKKYNNVIRIWKKHFYIHVLKWLYMQANIVFINTCTRYWSMQRERRMKTLELFVPKVNHYVYFQKSKDFIKNRVGERRQEGSLRKEA